MSRNQQIVILVVAVLFSAALIFGAYLKKHPEFFKDGDKPPVTTATGTSSTGQLTTAQQEHQRQVVTQAYKPPPPSVYDPGENVAVGEVVGQLRLLNVSLGKVISRRKLKMDYYERLSFGGTAGVDPNYAIFNPDGFIKFKPMLGKWIDQATLDKVTASKKGRILYSLRRQRDSEGGITDVLYAVIPFPSGRLCQAARHKTSIKAVLAFAPDNRQVVEDAPGTLERKFFKESGCVSMSDGKTIWLYPLRLRYMSKGTTNWQSY